MKKDNSSTLTKEQRVRLERLSALPDEAIDTSDIPEVRDWTGAQRGKFHTGAKNQDRIAIGVRSELVEWFEGNAEAGEDAESRINRVLSDHVSRQARKAS